jgi:hypothetical protein
MFQFNKVRIFLRKEIDYQLRSKKRVAVIVTRNPT